MSPWPYCGRSCPSTKVIPSTPVHIWFFTGFFCISAGRWCGVAWFGCRTKTQTDIRSVRCPSVYLLLPHLAPHRVHTVQLGRTLYSTYLCEHICTSLLTGKPHHGGSWRERKRGTSVSSQMSLAVTVPLITGFQTECGEAGHLPYCIRDSRHQ